MSPKEKQNQTAMGKTKKGGATEADDPDVSVPMDSDVALPSEPYRASSDVAGGVIPPPAYGDSYDQVDSNHLGLHTTAKVGDDGRVNIRIDQKTRAISSLLVPALRSQYELVSNEAPLPPPYIPPSLGGEPGQAPPPPMNVVIHVVGSRGDVQPFVALGKVLKDRYGHRVRLATHPVFKDFVTEHGLEFFTISGDPSELMAFMVKNPGLMPSFDTMRKGDIGRRRKNIGEMLKGCWRSCFEAGDGFGPEASDSNISDWNTDNGNPADRPFVADAIIANPPSFAHVHCAEKLGIPLHMMFTMPWSPTQAFPHPLANIQSSDIENNITNFISYALVDMMTWQGLGDVINRFRSYSLSLEPINLMWAPGMLARLKIPYTYCWSPALIPKPKDWRNHISISGFYFLSLASNFSPDPELDSFLKAGPPPVYIGFGSIVVDDPNAMTKLIFEAVEKTGQRALVSKGWGGFGAEQLGIPDSVYMLGNVPHDWLFKQVSCVVHHGGAGTTSAGIACGCPTVVVPFFGDQPFWGAMINKAGAGPRPTPHKQLTADNLAEAITEALRPETKERAKEMAAKIADEKGSEGGAQSFHQMLDVDKLRCSLAPSRVAVWRVKKTNIRLSAFAAAVLGHEGLLDFNDLKLYQPREYNLDEGPFDPLSGGAGALVGTMGSMMMGVADFPVQALRALKIHPDTAKKRNSNKASDSSGQSVSSQSAGSNGSLEKIESQTDTGHTSPTSTSTPATSRQDTQPMAQERSAQAAAQQELRSNPYKFDLESAIGTGKGVSRIVGAGLKSPMDFTMALAQGFHNAPKMYGDQTVRKQEKVTGFQSGMKAAGKGFGLGMYDGIAGLVTQPIEGAKKEGAAGFWKGVGRGVGGLVFKPGAAFWGIPGYTMKGIYKEMQKLFGSSVQNYIVAARVAQGYEDFGKALSQERQDVVKRLKELSKGLNKKKQNWDYDGEDALKEWHKLRRANAEAKEKDNDKEKNRDKGKKLQKPIAKSPGPVPSLSPSLTRAQTNTSTDSTDGSDEYEAAIKASVAQTSRGNPEEDQLIERAIRASLAELAPRSGNRRANNNLDLEKAMRESMNAANLEESFEPITMHESSDHDNDGDEVEVESTDKPPQDARKNTQLEDDEDAYLAEAIRQSKQSEPLSAVQHPGYDEEMRRAIELSKADHEAANKEQSEEEIVLQYIKKQSLKEEEMRGKGKAKMEPGNYGVEVDDEELKKAIRESLRAERGGGEGEGANR